MNIEQIKKQQQPDIHKELSNGSNKNKSKKKRRRKRKKERKPNSEHLSFSNWDKLMRERIDVNESRCRGR